MSIHNIFGDAAPGAFVIYNDGQPTTVGHVFQIAAGDTTPWEIAGGRLYVSSVTPKGAQAVISLSIGAYTTDPIREVTFTTPQTEGWVDVPWEPYVPVKGSPHTVSIRFPGRVDYFAAPSPTDDPIASPTLAALSLYGVGSSPARSLFRYASGAGGNSPTGPLWGLDVIVTDGEPLEEPEPTNAVPVVDAGPSRTMYVGQIATLTATATDTDGTVTGYDWFQVGGPTTALGGTGAQRTFSPPGVGTYTFAVVATDDGGAESTPDTVTITVLAALVEPVATGGTARPVAKMGSVERALMALFVRDLEVLEGSDANIGGEFPRTVEDFYIRLDRVPGGRATTLDGDYVIDIEVFSHDYLRAEDIAEDIEVLMLADGYHSIITGGKRWTFDAIFQNVGIADLPWEADEDISRLMATYAITVRRGAA